MFRSIKKFTHLIGSVVTNSTKLTWVQQLRNTHFLIRLTLALGLGFAWMFIAHNFQSGLYFFSIPIDWIISALVLTLIYQTFFSLSNSNTK